MYYTYYGRPKTDGTETMQQISGRKTAWIKAPSRLNIPTHCAQYLTLPYVYPQGTPSLSVRLSPLTHVNLLGLAHNRHQSVRDKSTDIRVKHLPLGRPGVETLRPNLQVLFLHWLQIPIHAHEHGATSMLRSLAARPCRTYGLNPPPGIPASSDKCETKRPAGRNTARSHGL